MEKAKIITRETLKEWIDAKVNFILIDVLSKNSYEFRHLPGAKNIPYEDDLSFLDQVAKIVPRKDITVVVYCASFHCQLSVIAANRLMKAGYTDVYHFAGGLADWDDAGYPFETKS